MSKQSSIIGKIPTDTSIDHATHTEYRKDCSSCWAEKLLARRWARNERIRNGIGRNHFTDAQLSPNPFDR